MCIECTAYVNLLVGPDRGAIRFGLYQNEVVDSAAVADSYGHGWLDLGKDSTC